MKKLVISYWICSMIHTKVSQQFVSLFELKLKARNLSGLNWVRESIEIKMKEARKYRSAAINWDCRRKRVNMFINVYSHLSHIYSIPAFTELSAHRTHCNQRTRKWANTRQISIFMMPENAENRVRSSQQGCTRRNHKKSLTSKNLPRSCDCRSI